MDSFAEHRRIYRGAGGARPKSRGADARCTPTSYESYRMSARVKINDLIAAWYRIPLAVAAHRRHPRAARSLRPGDWRW